MLTTLAKEWEHSSSFWTATSILSSLAISSNRIWFVPGQSRTWIGFLMASFVSEDVELLYVYASPEARGQGIGHLLLENLISTATAQPLIQKIFLEVRPSNLAAIRLYESHRFVRTGIRRRYYKDGEDALIYEYAINR